MKTNTQYLLSTIITITCLSRSIIVGPIQAEPVSATHLASLENFSNCSTLIDALKTEAIKNMEQRVNVSRQYIIQRNARENGLCELYRNPCGLNPCYEASEESQESAMDYSETNVQIKGVDEADFVKNDGSYIYMLVNGQLKIVKAWPPEETAEVSAFDIEYVPQNLFVHDGRAFIYSSIEHYFYNPNRYRTNQSKITILDISDVTTPKLVREMYFFGKHLNARRIGSAIHSALSYPGLLIPDLKYHLEYENHRFCEKDYSTEELNALFDALIVENTERIQSIVTGWLPSVTDIRYNTHGVSQEDYTLLENCNDSYLSQPQNRTGWLSIVSTDIHGNTPLHATTILGGSDSVYASKSALYVVTAEYSDSAESWFGFDSSIKTATRIHKFHLTNNPPTSQYRGNGIVKGHVINQFSMDEFEDFFRIATTHRPDTHSTISILEEKANELVVVGQIDNIAPGEDIRSARFMGDKGYVVTFKKVDPLFAFDLSDPYHPTIEGELKIPGFSTYMHRLNNDHLLTIGYDADEQDNFAWFQGIMLQMFDVADMTNPMLTHKEIIGARGSTSDAATNHLAFNYFDANKLLAIPMTICERNENAMSEISGGVFGDVMTFSGLLIYQVNPDTGFKLCGGIPHRAPENWSNNGLVRQMSRVLPPPERDWDACYNWWRHPNSYVKRSIFMDNYVFSITENTIKANHLSALGQDVAILHFDDQPKCDTFHVDLCHSELDCLSVNGQWEENTCRLPLYPPHDSSGVLAESCVFENTVVGPLPPIPLPTTGHINNTHNYLGQTITDATITSSGNIANAILAGDITNQGWLSNITVLEGTTLKGGTVTGSVSNNGIVKDITFVGHTIEGGKLAGTITIDSKIGLGLGILEDVSLLPDTILEGGQLIGNITGSAEQKPIIKNVEVGKNTDISHVIIGQGTRLSSGVKIGTGVRFANNDLIPSGADLTVALSTDNTIDMNTDVLKNGPSLLMQINELPEMQDNHWQLYQNPDNGQWEVMVDGIPIVIKPVHVKQAHDQRPTLIMNSDGSVTVITTQGRNILVQIDSDPK